MTKITLDVHRFPCLNDNYGYLVHEAVSGQTAAIDTPDADKYLAEADRITSYNVCYTKLLRPTYDVRFVGVNEPLNVTYKANIKQNTGIDWKDVNVVLSTAKTNLSRITSYNVCYTKLLRCSNT